MTEKSVGDVLGKLIEEELEKRLPDIKERTRQASRIFGISEREVKQIAKPVIQRFVENAFGK